MDGFRVEVIDVAEEAARLKETAKAALKAEDKDEEEGREQEAASGGIPCTIQVTEINAR